MRRLLRFARCSLNPAILTAMVAFSMSGPAVAQTTTGTLRGTVQDETGGTLPGATVEAKNDETGFMRNATTAGNGFFNISVQPGPYTVTATLPSFRTETRKVQVLLGETQSLDFRMILEARASQAVTVTAEAPVIEAKSNEIATNVTEEQLKSLPQDSRNFLKFAALAPGVRFNDDPNGRKEVTMGALEGFATNVFIDGTSYKNDVLLGGVVGQDSSRGNPFPQNAVQEFRVLTQNFKAEYEKSSSGVITAVTKSGTNELKGDAFAEYQNKSLVAIDACSRVGNPCNATPNDTKPDFTRWQAGVSVGGPIVNDKVHFYASWELNSQNRANRVLLGGAAGSAPPALVNQLRPFEGFFTSPFRENLFFGKVSVQATASDVIDTSGFYRRETDVRDFGGQRSLEVATDIKQDIYNVQARNSLAGQRYLSETDVSYQSSRWNPVAVNPGLVGLDYQNLLRIGGQDTGQNFLQKRFSVRQDFSLLDIHAAGDHVVKAGFVANFNHYDVQKLFNANPVFRFRAAENFAFPFQAQYGFGNPDLSTHNNQYGLYIQDDWTINPRLTVNAGLRWDYETDDLNNKFVTSALVRSELSGKIPDGYFTDGTQRSPYAKAYQPRVGFSFDLSGKGTTVVFGGWGRYYDRNYYNALLDEKFRLQYSVLNFEFSADGLPRSNGTPTIMWNPSYLSLAGLQGIVASGKGGKPEAFLIRNDTVPPLSDQFSFGFRQSFGQVGASISYAGTRSRNGFTFVWGDVGGVCCTSPSPAFRNVLLSDASKRYWYDALFLTLDKRYTPASKWGASVAYTYGHATQTGNDLFSLDSFGNGRTGVAGYPRHSTPTDERHRIVVSGLVGIPWDVKLSTFLTLSSGLPFTIDDQSQGGDFPKRRFILNGGRQEGTFPFQQWDLQLQKNFSVTKEARFGVSAGVFNVTDHANYGCFDGFIATLPSVNKRFGQPGCTVTSPRRLQLGFNLGI